MLSTVTNKFTPGSDTDETATVWTYLQNERQTNDQTVSSFWHNERKESSAMAIQKASW